MVANAWRSFLSKYLKRNKGSTMKQKDKFRAAGKEYRASKGISKKGGRGKGRRTRRGGASHKMGKMGGGGSSLADTAASVHSSYS